MIYILCILCIYVTRFSICVVLHTDCSRRHGPAVSLVASSFHSKVNRGPAERSLCSTVCWWRVVGKLWKKSMRIASQGQGKSRKTKEKIKENQGKLRKVGKFMEVPQASQFQTMFKMLGKTRAAEHSDHQIGPWSNHRAPGALDAKVPEFVSDRADATSGCFGSYPRDDSRRTSRKIKFRRLWEIFRKCGTFWQLGPQGFNIIRVFVFIIRIQFPRPEYRRELHNQGWGLLLPRWGKIPWGSFHVFSHAWLSRSFARCIMYVVPCRTMSYLTRPYTSVSDLRKVQKLGLTTESMFVFDMEISHTTWVTRVTRLSCCLDCAVSFLGRVGPSCHADLDYGHSIYPFHFVDPFCCFWFLGNIDIEHAQQSLASIWVVHV